MNCSSSRHRIVVPTRCMYPYIGMTLMYVCTLSSITRTFSICMYVRRHSSMVHTCSQRDLQLVLSLWSGEKNLKNTHASPWCFRSHRECKNSRRPPRGECCCRYRDLGRHQPCERASEGVRFHADDDGGGDGRSVATTCMCATRSPPCDVTPCIMALSDVCMYLKS